MMQKMGYERGQGLGKEGKGIAQPIEAVKRPGRGALGAYGPEAKGPKMPSAKRTESESESDDEEETGQKAAGQWKKEAGRKRPKYKYKTIDELIAEGGHLQRQLGLASATGQQNAVKVRLAKVYAKLRSLVFAR